MRTYILHLFYDTASVSQDLAHIKKDIESVSGNDWIVLGAGARASAMGFRTDVQPRQLKALFSHCGNDRLSFLLTDTTELIDGYLGTRQQAWLEARVPAKKP